MSSLRSRSGLGPLGLQRLNLSNGAAHGANTRRLFELAGGSLEAQIELLLLQLTELLDELVVAVAAEIGNFHGSPSLSVEFTKANNHLGLDGKLGGGALERNHCDVVRNAIKLKHDPAWLDAGSPEFRRALTLTHADFGRL